MPNKSLIGSHWIPVHNRKIDLDFIAAANAPFNKIVGGPLDVSQVSAAYAVSRGSKIILRDHPLSEQHSDYRANPAATGVRHALEMIAHFERMERQAAARGIPFPSKREVVLIGMNEPILDAGPRADMNYDEWLTRTRELSWILRDYTISFMNTLTAKGYIGGAFNISVGWPTNLKDNHPSYWGFFDGVEEAIRKNGGYLVLHEYFSFDGPSYNAGWWAYRFRHCPWNVPIIIGECGVDQYVKDGNKEKSTRGWKGMHKDENVAWERYVDMLIEYEAECFLDPRIVGITPFTFDCNHDDWGSFDIGERWQSLIRAIETRISKNRQRPTGSPQTKYIAAALLNARSGPGMEYEIQKVYEHGSEVKVIERRFTDREWSKITDGYWMASEYLVDTKPEPLPVPEPVKPPANKGDDFIDLSIIIALFGNPDIEPCVIKAIFAAESGGRFFSELGKPVIRFENHVFVALASNPAAAKARFFFGTPSFTGHKYINKAGVLVNSHTSQEAEWESLEIAATIDQKAAYDSISIGIAQLMGFNHVYTPFSSAKEMLEAASSEDKALAKASQLSMFFGYLEKRGMIDAIVRKDWNRIAELYNGAGNVGAYAAAIKFHYDRCTWRWKSGER